MRAAAGRLLMLGAGPLQVPAIMAAKALGWHVTCADWNPDSPGFAYADERSLTSTLDADAVVELARAVHADRVMTSTSDAPVRVAAYACERLGLPCGISYADAVCATEKDAMRERLAERGVPVPGFEACADLAGFARALERFGWECVVKPADSSASRGVELVDGELGRAATRGLYDSVRGHSRKGTVMVEERVRGAEVSVEALTVGGRTDVVAVTDKVVTAPPRFVELGHSEPSALGAEALSRVREVAERTVAAIGIVDGPSHTEVMVTERGPVVIETAARLGGDFITSRLVPLSTGVDLVGASVRLALGLEPDLRRGPERGAAIRFLTVERPGTVASVEVGGELARMPGVEEIEIYLSPGDSIGTPRSSNDRVGHVICTGETSAEASGRADEISGLVTVSVRS